MSDLPKTFRTLPSVVALLEALTTYQEEQGGELVIQGGGRFYGWSVKLTLEARYIEARRTELVDALTSVADELGIDYSPAIFTVGP